MITRKQLIKKYLEFFKKRNHKEVPNSSLVLQNDPTVLFTTAGMHPLIPYLLGTKHPLGKRLCNIQKCIRTGDIDSVGDDYHLTFFEMLGNWSLGDYFKEHAIKFSFDFLTKELQIPKEKMHVTCFKGDKDSPRDKESAGIWKSLGIQNSKIRFLGKADNWWGPAGKTGPCGPDTEMFIGERNKVEIWNDVFMEYDKTSKGKYLPLSQKNVDTGMGVERTLAVLNNKKNFFETEVFQPIIKEIEKLSKKTYGKNKEITKAMRIVADHMKAAVFILSEKIQPGNVEHSYVLRRLIRRAIRYGKFIGIENFTQKLVKPILDTYQDYQELSKNKKFILLELEKEEKKFKKTLERGLKKFEHFTRKKTLNGINAFLLYQSYGFPLEMIKEETKKHKIKFDEKQFKKEHERHQKFSRTASEGRFKSGLQDKSEQTKKLHTATHLLNEVLRKVLGQDVKQRGSNITPERLRFDFSFDRKLTDTEKKQIEISVNEKIQEDLSVVSKEIPLQKAIEEGAQAEFGSKYPEIVRVYTIEDPTEKRGWFSKEICTGPHVKNTGEIGKFKIIKEESSSSGIRRIKATIE